MDLSSLRVKELTEICKKLGIRASGKKADLVERLASSSAYQESLNGSSKKAVKVGGSRSNGLTGSAKRAASTELLHSASLKKQKGERQKIVDAIGLVFDKFQDEESMDSITDDGIFAFCEELGIDPQDPVILVLSWTMEAAAMCDFTRTEFVRGFEKLNCVTMDDLRGKLPFLRAKLRDQTEFTHIYSFTFGFAKDPTQKSLALDIATGLWELLLPGYFPLLPHWLKYVRAHCRNSISKDVWMQVLDFGVQIKPNLTNFDENGAWPVLLDDFVTHMQDEFKERGVEAVLKEGADDAAAMMAIDSSIATDADRINPPRQLKRNVSLVKREASVISGFHTGADRGPIECVLVVRVVRAAQTGLVDAAHPVFCALRLRFVERRDARRRAEEHVLAVALEAAAHLFHNVQAKIEPRAGIRDQICQHWDFRGSPLTAILPIRGGLARDLVGGGLQSAVRALVVVLAREAVVVEQSRVLFGDCRVARVVAKRLLVLVRAVVEYVRLHQLLAVAREHHVAFDAALQLGVIQQKRVDFLLGGHANRRLLPKEEKEGMLGHFDDGNRNISAISKYFDFVHLLRQAPRLPRTRSAPVISPSSPSGTTPASPGHEYKLSARHHHHRKRRDQITVASGKDLPLRSQTALQQRQNVRDAFRSVAVLGEVVRLETGANHSNMQPEEAFALLRRILFPSDLFGADGEDGASLPLSELLDGIEAACWRTLAAERPSPGNGHSREELMLTTMTGGGASPRSLHCQVHNAHNHHDEFDSPRRGQPASYCYEPNSAFDGADPIRLRHSQLHRGVQVAILEKQRVLESLKHKLQQAIDHNDELPNVIKDREATIQKLKKIFMSSASKKLDCEGITTSTTTMNITKQDTSAMAAAVEDKVQTLRRRRDLRAWACNELRSAINDHMTRASELKKEISAIAVEVKKEEMAHKLKAKRVEAIIASTSPINASAATVAALIAGDSTIRHLPPEEIVTQAHEKKEKLLEAIEQRKVHLRARTEEVFNARNEVGALEQKRAEVVERAGVLQQEIAHIQRACTPRPEWTQLLNAALVTTAIDRAGKKAKLRMESSRKKLMGGKGKRDDNDEHEESGDERLKQILTSNWSTIEKVRAMSEELTRIRTKYHAGDTITVEQAKLDHLQKEIAKALQQLEAIKEKTPSEDAKQ